jgi:hypothetical protein
MRLVAFDFDKTLINSPLEDEGKEIWLEKTGNSYPYKGWWGRPESLDINVFNIKPFPSIYKQYKKEISTPDTYVIILTSRIEKLRPQIEAILNKNDIHVNEIDMFNDKLTKGQRILEYLKKFPDLIEINVYEDRQSDIVALKSIRNQIPENITYNIYYASNGNLVLLESTSKINNIVKEEIEKFINNDNYIYHGTHIGAGFHIQRDGKMKLFNEPYISFTSDPNVAKYYANMKGGSSGRNIILRTNLTKDFQESPKYEKNNGHEWITTKEIPVDELEINSKYGWIPLNNWDFIDNNIKK